MSRLVLSEDMLAQLDRVIRAPKGKRIGILGCGIVGRAMARYLGKRGARLVLVDQRETVDGLDELKSFDVEFIGGINSDSVGDARALYSGAFDGIEALAVSPGVDPRQVVVQTALERDIPVFGELELASPLNAKVIAITGTNGKSTTTALIGELVRACGLRAFVGGNLGDPIIGFCDSGEDVDVMVLELSSFQLETAYRFRADVAVILNLTPDHTDRYASFAAYGYAKARLVENQRAGDVAILNYDDPHVAAMAAQTQAHVRWLSTAVDSLTEGATWNRTDDSVNGFGGARRLSGFSLMHERLMGRHNRENALAALLAVDALQLSHTDGNGALASGYRVFSGLEHRLENVATIKGVTYINDSKATNDDAAAIAVRAVNESTSRPIVALVGGRDKGAGYHNLLASAKGHVRLVLAFGEARQEVEAAMAGHIPCRVFNTLWEAFVESTQVSREGDVVLLVPACSSFDEFKNYSERGRTFKSWVHRLAAPEASNEAREHLS